jgi:hypothetical protein
MNNTGSKHLSSIGFCSIGLGACCLLALLLVFAVAYFWYFQQLADKVTKWSEQQPKPAEQQAAAKVNKPLMMKKITLPEPPALTSTRQAAKIATRAATKIAVEIAASPAPDAASIEPQITQAIVKVVKPKAEIDAVSQPTKRSIKRRIIDVSKPHNTSADSEQLLTQVEAGQGPGIEIAWPESFAKRKQLFNTLVNCLGVQLGILVGEEVHPIRQDANTYSRLVRVVSGMMLPVERQLYESSRYKGIEVRLFPRSLDARLLAGLRQLSPSPIQSLHTVHGLYVLQGKNLLVEQLVMDGQVVNGQILLADRCGR